MRWRYTEIEGQFVLHVRPQRFIALSRVSGFTPVLGSYQRSRAMPLHGYRFL